MKTNDEFKNPKAATTQTAKIFRYLMQGRRLTQLEALQRFGCLRLSARIKDLRDYGYAIECENYKTSSGKRVGRYYIKVENRK